MKTLITLVLIVTGSAICSQPCTTLVPDNLQATYTLGAGATLSWDAVPGTVACQVNGEKIGSGTSKNVVVSEFEADGTFIPNGFLDAGADYAWRVRCACSTSPLNVSAFSDRDTFFVFPSNTVGVTKYMDSLPWIGYNVHYPHNQQSVYLLDNCGRKINVWEDSIFTPGNTARILEDGKLLRLGSRGGSSNPVFTAGGSGNVLQLKSWNNSILWQYEISDSVQRLHHDFALLPNGNILQIVFSYRSAAEAIQAGRNPTMIPGGEVHPDMIIEIEPVLPDSANIVWQWNAWDHLIQDHDPTKDNFGVVSDHPERININYGDMVKDWMHTNSINYVEEFDLILISVPTFNEFWIIDHSTTTAEAAGSTGGTRGKGGDLLYRWGNPAAYNRGVPADAKLAFQHDVHRIDDFIDSSVADFGKVMLFNNRIGGFYSTVDIIDVPWNASGDFPTLAPGAAWGPAAADWTYSAPVPTDLYSSGLSGAQRLPNGNTLIDVGRRGRAFEIGPDESIVWEYQNPIINGNIVDQGTTNLPNNLLFRFNRYPTDYAGFAGRNLTPGDVIEGNASFIPCALDGPLRESAAAQEVASAILLYPNPATGHIRVVAQNAATVEIYNMSGQLMHAKLVNDNVVQFDVSYWANGAYLVVADSGERQLLIVE